jgi:hypothetical protein
MATWIEDLESNIKNSLGNKKKVAKSSQDPSLIWLFGVILLLAVGVFTVMKFKPPATQWQQPSSSASDWYAQQNPQQQPQGWTMPWQQQSSTDQKVDALKIQYDKLDSAAHKIWDRTKWNSDRMTLLATISNHNTVVIQQNYPKIELIYLNEDWTINRMPNRIALDKADQEFLKQFIRK